MNSDLSIRQFLEATEEGAFALREERVVYANPALAAMLDHAGPEALHGRNLADMLAPHERDRMLARHRARLAGQAVENRYPVDLLAADGRSHRPVILQVTLVREADGTPIVYGTVTPLSLLRAAEREEGRRRLVLARATEQSPSAVIITDARGRIEYVNPRFLEISGYDAETVLGQNPRLFKSPDTSSRIYEGMWQTIAGGGIWRGEIKNRRADGSHYWVVSAISAIVDEAGRVTNYVAVQEDITERHRLQAELTHAMEEAERASRAKSDFLANMSHELRTPLNSVLGYAQLLEMQTPEEEERRLEYIRSIIASGDHLLFLINEILDLAKVESGRMKLADEAIDPDTLLADCVGIIRPHAERRGIRLERDDTCADAPLMRGDGKRARQILLNLLSNAIKYNREQGRVTISCARMDGARLRMAVTDTGPGIPEERQDAVFTAFDRMGADEAAIEGTGIGLPLSRQLAEQMNGAVDFCSTVGEGSAFWLELPLAEG